MPAQTSHRIDQLDGIRALAIALVFLNHAFHIRLLWAGVDLFFILSGFLITGILFKQKRAGLGAYFAHFYGRRARRILPPYLLLLVITMIFFGIFWLRHWYMYGFLMNLFDPLRIPIPENFQVLWSLAVEEQFYLVWPFAIFLLNEKWLGRTAAGLIVLAPLLRWTMTPLFPNYQTIYMLTPFRMDLLACGALLSIAWRQHRVKIERWGAWGLALSAAAVGALVFSAAHWHLSTTANTRTGNTLIYEFNLLACLGFIVWALSGRGVGILRLKPVVFLGRISYSFYLIHTTFLVLLRPTGSPLRVAAVSFAGSLLYSTLAWYLLERPILYTASSKTQAEARTDEAAIVRPGS